MGVLYPQIANSREDTPATSAADGGCNRHCILNIFASFRQVNVLASSSSLRSRPWKLSANPFCQGALGSMYSVFTFAASSKHVLIGWPKLFVGEARCLSVIARMQRYNQSGQSRPRL
jgi:hypothetical protein